MSAMMELAKELGGAMARTDEYRTLRRALGAADDDRELTTLRNRMSDLEAEIAASIRAGQEPEETVKDEYQETFSRLQSNPTYQRLVAAQTNFDKVLMRVNDTITKALDDAGDSPIVLLS